MLYTLHPNVPPSTGNRLNRNQQLRVNAYVEGERGTGRRERVFYHEDQDSYLSRPIENQLQLETTRLGAGHNTETGEIEGDVDELINHINKKFAIEPVAVERAIAALNTINRKSRTC